MRRKRYLALGLAFVAAVAIGFAGWGWAGSAVATPGKTCNPEPGHGTPGCHVGSTPTTEKEATTTTAKKSTSTTARKSTPTTAKKSTATTAKPTTTTTTPTTTTGATAATTAPVAPAGGASFSDVPSSHPNYKQIADMVARQVVGGNADGTFKPDDPVTRQLFARMIVKAMGLTVTGNEICPFTDVAGGQDADPLFPDKYVAVIAAEGITLGDTPSTFSPNDNLTRQQLLTMVARAAKLSDPATDFVPPFGLAQFYPEEHYANARKLASLGLLEGLQQVDSAFDFMAPSTRGEVSVMLYNLVHRSSQ